MSDTKPISLAVFVSGGGTTLQNFIDLIRAGQLPARISVVLASRKSAYGLVRAEDNNIPSVVVPSVRYKKDWKAMSAAINESIAPYEIDLICLAGFMCLYEIPPQYEGKVMNIHPALIPAFCGEDFYGHHVHEGVLEYGAKVSGCTVHFANNEYDHGPIIVQRTVPVLDDDTPETLAARVFEQECIAYPEAIRLFAEGRLKIEGRRVRILEK
jgi:phosphoribosylglycinamide formyltransferase-1